MPKIVINEYDKTKADVTEYSNFSVVVPGYIASDKFKEIFDENGIYECSSVSDFESKIGKVAIQMMELPAVAPTITTVEDLNEETYYNKYLGQVYIGTENPDQEDIGYLKDENLIYSIANKIGAIITYDEHLTYYVIKPGNEGSDAKYAVKQCGNQIAYELLKNGYTVLYKLIDNTEGSTLADLEEASYWECLKDKATYDFRYITTGGYFNASAYEQIVNVATFVNGNYITDKNKDITTAGRGDCIALIDIIEDNIEATTMSGILTAIKTQVKSWSWANKYTGIFVPQVDLDIEVDPIYQNVTFPASIYYLLCANEAFIINDYSEWYAVAGYTRGTCSYKITGTTLGKFGEVAINTLEPRYSDSAPNSESSPLYHSVNVVAKIRNNYYIWGNRTAHLLNNNTGLVASHFLNIRQLLCTLKKELYVACRKFTFSPNSDLLWVNFCNAIRPTLEKMKADQGLRDYKIVKVATSTKALLKAKIRIVPIEAVEDFEMNISLEDSISGVSVGIDE